MKPPYPECTPYPGSTNRHGDVEKLDDVEVTHWFTEAAGSRYHYVTAGDPDAPAVVMLHGLPESWFAWHHQIADLVRDRHVIAIDLKGYGQSDKRLDLVYSFPHCAFEIAVLLDTIGCERFDLVGHDRGAVMADQLFGVPGDFPSRIRRYARLQQSFNQAHAEPRPPHALMASPQGTEVFLSEVFPRMVYAQVAPPGLYQITWNDIPEADLARIEQEWRHPGVAQAVTQCFVHTNFDREMEDRRRLIPRMRCPVHLIQAALDPGQPPSNYEGLEALGSNFTIEWLEGLGHFSHLEDPAAVSAAIRGFFDAPLAEDRS